MLTKHAALLVPLLLCVTITEAHAQEQSLAEASKQALEARAAKKAAEAKSGEKVEAAPEPKTTYTNTDLKAVPAVATKPAPAVKAAATPAPQSESERQAEYRQIAIKDEAYWKSRLQGLRSTLEADVLQLAAMELRVASLSADFDRTSSVSQRGVLRRERESAATEAMRLRADVASDRALIFTAEEEARRAGAPPGWLRP